MSQDRMSTHSKKTRSYKVINKASAASTPSIPSSEALSNQVDIESESDNPASSSSSPLHGADSDAESELKENTNSDAGGNNETDPIDSSSKPTSSDETFFIPKRNPSPPSNPGGLFGEHSVPSSVPSMPKLIANNAAEFNVWKYQAKAYFQQNGLHHYVLVDNYTSLQRAFNDDQGNRLPYQVRSIWYSVQGRIFGAIRAAVEHKLGSAFFDNLEEEGDVELSRYDVDSIDWLSKFKWGNARYLWTTVESQFMKFHPHDLATLVGKYMDTQYKIGDDPMVFKNKFEAVVRDLEVAGLKMPEKLHMIVWYRAMPEAFGALKQSLNADPNLTYNKIFQALSRQVSSDKSIKLNKSQSSEQAAVFADNQGNKDNRNKQNGNKNKFNKGGNGKFKSSNPQNKSKYYCNFCDKPGHTDDRCFVLKQKKENAVQGINEAKREHSACFIEEDAKELTLFTQDENVNSSTESEKKKPIYFLFDSGATTHVVNNKSLLHNQFAVPEVQLTTSVRGKHATISTRGTVYLNDKWSLMNVAYVPSATTNIISEGRLTDAGYRILKNNEWIKVVDRENKPTLTGVRVNRLWVYLLGDEDTPRQPKQELRKRGNKPREPIPDADEDKNPSQPSQASSSSSSSSSTSSPYSYSTTSSTNIRNTKSKARGGASSHQ